LKIGTMGFGVWTVSGRSRVPLPPARRIAFMSIHDHNSALGYQRSALSGWLEADS
jgi:hypothetical protein